MVHGIYIHIPFCRRKCTYCDFNSFPDREGLISLYLTALRQEIYTYARRLNVITPIKSLYFGGGTPTLLTGEGLRSLLDFCCRSFPVDACAEITIEANPEGLSEEKLTVLRRAGFNRLSLGVQSFDDYQLIRLGRGHCAVEIQQTVAAARISGFENLSIDLIYALPGQGIEMWKNDILKALELSPDHLSAYALTLEEGTPLFREYLQGELTLPDEDSQVTMYRMIQEIFSARGYRHYEISNFSIPGREARHNLLYWHNQEYLGMGAGAHSYLAGRRYSNISQVEEYIEAVKCQGSAVCEEERPTLFQQAGETIMLGLRLMDGLDLSDFAHRFNCSLEKIYPEALDNLITEGLLSSQGKYLKLTPKGILLSNEVFSEFL